jgi:hypothetical protein
MLGVGVYGGEFVGGEAEDKKAGKCEATVPVVMVMV